MKTLLLFPGQLSLADLSGFAGIVLAGIASALMVLRGRILKHVKNLTAVRSLHIAVSALAGIFIVVHVSFYFTWPFNFGILLGYATVAIAIVVWITGTAFLEKVRDSLLFHSSFSIVFISLALIHAAQTGPNIPQELGDVILFASVAVLIVNLLYQLSKMHVSAPKKKPVAPRVGQA